MDKFYSQYDREDDEDITVTYHGQPYNYSPSRGYDYDFSEQGDYGKCYSHKWVELGNFKYFCKKCNADGEMKDTLTQRIEEVERDD